MDEIRARIESALRQAYRAGWYDRAGGTGPDVDPRNEAEDRFMTSFSPERILALLPTEGEPVKPVAWMVEYLEVDGTWHPEAIEAVTSLKDAPSDITEEWRAFDKSGWFWWGRALGAFMRTKILALLPTEGEPRYYAVERKEILGEPDIPVSWGRTRRIAEQKRFHAARTNNRSEDDYRIVPLFATPQESAGTVWHWCLRGGWKRWPQVACSYCGSQGPNIHTLTFEDERPNWTPQESTEPKCVCGYGVSSVARCPVHDPQESAEVEHAELRDHHHAKSTSDARHIVRLSAEVERLRSALEANRSDAASALRRASDPEIVALLEAIAARAALNTETDDL